MSTLITRTASIYRGSFFLLMAFVIVSCLPTPQVKQLNKKLQHQQIDIPNRIELTKVPFYAQTKYHCGPSAVATLLDFKGHSVNYNDIVKKVYTPGRKGSLQTDVITIFRRYGYLSYVMQPKLSDLLHEVAAGRPVLVLQNLGIKWISKWHYAVVVGYDLKLQKIILRSGKHKRKLTSFKLFERTWKRSKYWALLALKPGELPAIPRPLNYLRAASGLEQVKNWRAAKLSYQKAELHWPNNLIAKMGVANAEYSLGRKSQAIRKYQEIIKSHPKAADAYNNLASLLIHKKRYKEALEHVNTAINLGGGNSKVYQSTRKEILNKQ